MHHWISRIVVAAALVMNLLAPSRLVAKRLCTTSFNLTFTASANSEFSDVKCAPTTHGRQAGFFEQKKLSTSDFSIVAGLEVDSDISLSLTGQAVEMIVGIESEPQRPRGIAAGPWDYEDILTLHSRRNI